ncbi:hypothetical protein MRB53_003479 [Persea americana]|uniref:Uncharacterized protein n=1 Tax=Persea americana TaxID=3435 RepID=A0ACC2MXG5_PERAE|nr:hypothetical protein MRB53_003479 [Persea americana]
MKLLLPLLAPHRHFNRLYSARILICVSATGSSPSTAASTAPSSSSTLAVSSPASLTSPKSTCRRLRRFSVPSQQLRHLVRPPPHLL